MVRHLGITCFVYKREYTIWCHELGITVIGDSYFDAESKFCKAMAEVLPAEELENTRAKFKWI